MKRMLKGDPDFANVVANDGYFIDKTLLIQEFVQNEDLVVLLPRPRRFGKTMNLSMVEHFLDVNKPESAPLFSHFKISADKAFCEQHQNKYPVINVSLKGIRGQDWEQSLEQIKQIISELFQKHKYLLKSDKLEDFEKKDIKGIIQKNGIQSDYEFSLRNLSGYLKSHFGAKAILLVDEYDTPIIAGYVNQYYKKVVGFMQVFMGSAFKENPHMQKGLITGIMRIARESIFSEMNNVGVYILTSLYFSDKFGFTEEETRLALEYFGLQDQFEGVQYWYNGYQFGRTEGIYNPWSIVNFISRHEEGFKPYWVNTGTDPLIKQRILEPDINQTYDTLQKLIAGETIEKFLDENFVFADLDTDRELLWTLLTFSGYLTPMRETERGVFQLRIPNHEVKTVFQDIVIKWLQIGMKVQRELLVATAEHLVNNRIPQFEKGFKKIIGDTFSYFDAQGEPENVWQAYVLGLLAVIGDDYVIRSNRESGEGRYDIMLIPHDRSRYGVVMEIKQIKREEGEEAGVFRKKINEKLAQATRQIEQNQYHKELLAHRVANIISLPVIFAGKEPFVQPLV